MRRKALVETAHRTLWPLLRSGLVFLGPKAGKKIGTLRRLAVPSRQASAPVAYLCAVHLPALSATASDHYHQRDQDRGHQHSRTDQTCGCRPACRSHRCQLAKPELDRTLHLLWMRKRFRCLSAGWLIIRVPDPLVASAWGIWRSGRPPVAGYVTILPAKYLCRVQCRPGKMMQTRLKVIGSCSWRRRRST